MRKIIRKSAHHKAKQFVGYAIYEVGPHTARTHRIRSMLRIRMHLQAIGLPILSDSVYGDGRPFDLSNVKSRYREKREEKPLLQRTALHAKALSFRHPRTGERVSFSAPLPKDMSTVLKYLRKFRQGIARPWMDHASLNR